MSTTLDFIGLFHRKSVRSIALMDMIFQAISKGAVEAVTSSVTLAECLVHLYRHGNLRLVEQFRHVITAGTHTSSVGVDAVAENAAEL
jgi:hypothetical protein